MKKAVFFDRDDTLIYDVPYNGDSERVELMPGAVELCRELKKQDFLLFIVSNQSGVGRGLVSEQKVAQVNDRILSLIGQDVFSAVYCCYEIPDNPANDCRKPSPRMLLNAARDYDIDLNNSFMIGDKLSDVHAGKNAGCRTVFFNSRNNKADLAVAVKDADLVVHKLIEFTSWLKECERRS